MATLEIDLNCMCLFVPDPHAGDGRGTVHVLMPCTHHQASADRHVVQMDFRGTDGRRQIRRLEGWALELGSKPGTARTTLQKEPPPPPEDRFEIVNLTTLARKARGEDLRADPALLNGANRDVVSRITLHGGGVTAVNAQEDGWILNGVPVVMPHQVIWRMEVTPEELRWTELDPAGKPQPLASLEEEVVPDLVEGKEVYRLHVHHVAEKVLREREEQIDPAPTEPLGGLDPVEIKRHFKMFYDLLGIRPDEDLLPMLPVDPNDPNSAKGGAPTFACKVAVVSL